MERVVVIIPALNAARTLGRQLEALNNQSDLDFRVIVSDNGSTDSTASLAASWRTRFHGIAVIDASLWRGVASARNIAIEASDEELVLICDADDRVHPGWVAAMRRGLRKYDAVTGPLVAIHGEGRQVVLNEKALPVSMGYLPYAPGGNIGIRRECLERLGGFRVDMSLGQEDVDFGWRMAQCGMQIGHEPEAALDYFQRSELWSLLRQQYRYGRAHVHLYLRHRDAPIRTAGWRTSVRWFLEWAKQLPRRLTDRQTDSALGALAFQIGRCVESLRFRTATPL